MNLNLINTVYSISFLDLFAIGLTFPLFNSHLRDLGASHYVIGLLGSCYSGTQIISGPLIGGWSDVRGKKSVLKITLLICCLCYGLLGLSNSIIVIFVLRFILGVIKHTQSISKAVITELLPINEQSSALGRSAAYGSIGFIAGPFIGGHLSELNNGFMYVCLVTSVLFILNFVLASMLPEFVNKRQITDNQTRILDKIIDEARKTIKNLLDVDWKAHWKSLILRFLFGLTISSYFSSQALYLKEKYDLSQKQVGYTISFYSTIGTVSAFYLNRINNFYKRDDSCYMRLLHFFTLCSLCLLGIYLTNNFKVFMILLIPFSICATIIRVVSMELMIKEATTCQTGSLSGASNSIMSLARFFTPMLAGVIGGLFGENSTMLLCVGPSLLGTFVSFYLYKFVQTKVKKQK